ncbi:Ankyrin repeat-containing domain protein [Rhypophila decipiens]
MPQQSRCCSRPTSKSTSKDNEKRIPLHYAAKNGHEAVCAVLLDQPLHQAGKAHHDAQTPDSKTEKPTTTLSHYTANSAPYSSTLERSLTTSRDAQMKAADVNNRTALHEAAGGGHRAVVKLLLELGSDDQMLKTTDEQRTALHEAARGGHWKVVGLLLDQGAWHTVRDAAGKTPLHLAAEFTHEEVARMLLSRGADPKLTTNDHLTVRQLVETRLKAVRKSEERATAAAADGTATPTTPATTSISDAKIKKWSEILKILETQDRSPRLSIVPILDGEAVENRFDVSIIDFASGIRSRRRDVLTVHGLLKLNKELSVFKKKEESRELQPSEFKWVHLPVNNL